jgi:hypothetical protein
MAGEHQDRGIPRPTSCKGAIPDCVQHMSCVGPPNISLRSAEMQRQVIYTTVSYWSLAEKRTGLSVEPDLFPPKASGRHRRASCALADARTPAFGQLSWLMHSVKSASRRSAAGPIIGTWRLLAAAPRVKPVG